MQHIQRFSTSPEVTSDPSPHTVEEAYPTKLPPLFLNAVHTAGYQAGSEGHPVDFNPYDPWSQPELYQAWASGWLAAKTTS